jgi:hypothetical protein
MNKRTVILFALLCIGVMQVAWGDGTPFFSEYIEGSAQNKALEIYNGTGETINLNNYRIGQSVNGGGWAFYHTFPQDATVADGDVWVITTDQADPALQAVADEILAYPSATHHNGNDARSLEVTADGGATWTILDVIGNPDEDPGDGWAVAGVAAATKDHTLVRKDTITQGNTDWAASAGTDADNSEWIVYPQDTFEYLGDFGPAGPDVDPPLLVQATASSLTTVTVQFNEALDQTTAETVANYSISGGLTVNAAVLSSSTVVTLTTSEQTAAQSYTITVNNVADLAGNAILAGSTVDFTGYDVSYDQIADIQANPTAYEGQTVTIHGIVTMGVNVIQTGNTNAYVQDTSGRGINIYSGTPITDLARGNEVEITGEVTQYFDTTEITNPQVTVLSTGNPEPDALEIDFTQVGEIDLEGTLLQITGEVYETYAAGGGVNLNIKDEDNNQMTVRVWDSTGLDLTDFVVGYLLQATGIGDTYNGALQIVPGYQDQLTEGTIGGSDEVTITPLDPTADDDVTISIEYPAISDNIVLFWKTTRDTEFVTEVMDTVSVRDYTYQAVIPAQKEGTTVEFFIYADTLLIPAAAPDELIRYSVAITKHRAVLNVEPKVFDPRNGETFAIQYGSEYNDKAILRIYNAEGKLVFEPVNDFINSIDGLKTYEWNGRDRNHKLLPIGLYIAHLEVIDRDDGSKKTAKAPIVIGAKLK